MIERDGERAALADALREARERRGAIVLVEGDAGIGKSTLLADAAAGGRAAGMLVLAVRADELEQSFSYAVVRQLFEPVISAADDTRRARLLSGAVAHAAALVDPARHTASALDASAVLHGLYWLAANLAAERPLAVIVDDLQWADEPTVAWLAYLANRLEALSVAVIVATRPVPAGDAVRDRLRTSPGLIRLAPTGLSDAAVDALAREALGEQVEQPFTRACHAATAGNPFFVTELLRSLKRGGNAGTAADLPMIEALEPDAIVAATVARLGGLTADARTVLEAVALLEPHAEPRLTCALTEIGGDEVAGAADALLAIGMLRSVNPCRFAHPILRAAVRSQIGPARRGRMHLRAGRVLNEAHLPAEAVGAHLLQAPAAGEPWIRATLRDAAAQAMARGAPSGAAGYLRRALAEHPDRSERAEVLLELGGAESHARQPAAADHLREALALADDPDQAAVAALALGQVLFNSGEIDAAYAAVKATVDASAHETPAQLILQAFALTLAGPVGKMAETAELAAHLRQRTPADSPAAGAVDACLALRALVSGDHRARVREQAERAAATVTLDTGLEAILGAEAPGMAFLWIDDLDRAQELFDDKARWASQQGRMRSFAAASALRGYTLARRGLLADAEADIQPILTALADGDRPGPAAMIAAITEVHLLIERDNPENAEALASFIPVPEAFERQPLVALLRYGQARAQFAQHKLAAAAATLQRVAAVCEQNSIRNPCMFPWRSTLALTRSGADRHAEAIALAEAELALADTTGIERARGVALRTLGLLHGGATGLARLSDAVDVFAGSPARLEHGWACYELGAALRRAGRRRDARAPLDLALDIGLQTGADRLTRCAGEEREALGARPRSVMLTGAESLTPSERRVCSLAAGGLKNTEIAQTLFVSLKTIETHLRSAYRKLDVASRTELAAAMS